MCSPIPVRTATTASPCGVPTSVRRLRTTLSSSMGATSPVTAVLSSGCVTRTAGRSMSWTPGMRPGGPRSTTATCHSARRPGTAAQFGWTGLRAVSTSSTRLKAVVTMSVWLFTSDPTFKRGSTDPVPTYAGPVRQRPGQHGLTCPAGCGGACTGVKPIPFSAGTPMVWDRAPTICTLIGHGRSTPEVPLTTRLDFLDAVKTTTPGGERAAASWPTVPF